MADRQADEVDAVKGGGRRPSSRGSIVNVNDLWVAVAILGGVAVLWYHSTLWADLPAFMERGLPPTLFPRIWLGTIAILTLFLPFEQYLRGEEGRDLDKERSHPVKGITYLTMLVMVPVSASMEWLGSVLVILLICIVLPLLWGERRLKILIPYVILFPPAVIFLFKWAFKVSFEPGVIGLGFK